MKFEYKNYENPKLDGTYIASQRFYNQLAEKFYAGSGRIDHNDNIPSITEYYVSDPIPIEANDLLGLTYKPLFPYFADQYRDAAFRIVEGDFVTTDEGTGIVHIAPGFGADDYHIWEKETLQGKSKDRGEDLPLLQHVTMEGRFTEMVTDFAGLDVKPKDDPTKTDKKIVEHLEKHDHIFCTEKVKHSYPHCWRCDSPLLNYATSSWFVTVENIKEKLLTNNKKTQWVPEHIRDGRFGVWLSNAKDWAISRNRYWGTPLPIWRTEDEEETVVITGRDELMQYCTDRFTKVTVLRHGESEGNVNTMYQSSCPGTDLTEHGKQQAQNAAAFLSAGNLQPRVIYTSPLARCQQTAQMIAKETDAKIIIDERLRETRFNECDGKPVLHDEEKQFRRLRKASARGEDVTSPWESWTDMQERIDAFFTETLPKHPGEHIIVVSHGDPLHNVRKFFTQEEPGKIVEHPMAHFASPKAYFWDHTCKAQMDLHRENVDDITWTEPNGKVFRRVPEVFDCWFESGSMPYSQENYPFSYSSFSSERSAPRGFPADFIAENLDQTRGWFYTLIVLSTALFDKPAFWNCICGGIILAEDGKKMSKSLKNYPDPNELMERQGADALRFALMSSPVVRAQSLRFSEQAVHEVIQHTLLPLWNAYSFFVTYANAAAFEPTFKHSASSYPLDQWIRAKLQDLTNRMTEQLDHYDLSATCNELHETIDALTNWYIRLSRRRFAGKEGNERQQQEGLQTLYDCLIQLSQLLAPFCPFITEAIYTNLSQEKNGSVHLTNWPEPRELTDHESILLDKNRVMRSVASLGLKVRSDAKIKIRQPLGMARLAIPPESRKNFSKEDFALLRDELNVKELTLVEHPEDLANALALVDARKVGPRLGSRIQEIIVAGKEGDFEICDDGNILILDEKLSPDEVEITYKGKEGKNTAGIRGIVISIDTTLTPELRQEGYARDLIRTIQKLRQESGLSFPDHIRLSIDGADELLKSFGDVIAEETRSHLAENSGEKHTVKVGETDVTIRFENMKTPSS